MFKHQCRVRDDFARHSPGNVVTAAVIEAAAARGRTEYDMLRGDESYKLPN